MENTLLLDAVLPILYLSSRQEPQISWVVTTCQACIMLWWLFNSVCRSLKLVPPVLSALKNRVLFLSTSLKKSAHLQPSGAVASRAAAAVLREAGGWKVSLGRLLQAALEI